MIFAAALSSSTHVASAQTPQVCQGGSTGNGTVYGSVTTCSPLPASTIATSVGLNKLTNGVCVLKASTFSACVACAYEAAFDVNTFGSGSYYTAGTHWVCMPPPFSPPCKTVFSYWFFSV